MTRPAKHQVEIVTVHNGENCTIEFEWEVDVYLYPIIPETPDSPQEGGPEIDGEPKLVCALLYRGKHLEGTIRSEELLSILLEGVDGCTPDEDDILSQADKDTEPDPKRW